MLQTPVLLLIFNRPDKTAEVFKRIREQQPAKLYVAADGPREGKAEDPAKCETVRNLVLKGVDWKCEVKTLFRNKNLGCGLAPSEAITWFFEQEEQGIILEDDCVPDPGFFTFCSELLTRYATTERIMMITGFSIQDKPLDEFSYYLSWYVHVWGWATWRRAWQHYDFYIKDFDPVEAEHFLKPIFKKKRERDIWVHNFDLAISKTDSIWDYQWMHAIWKNKGMVISPWRNMISNIGHGDDATHTPGYEANRMELPTYAVGKILHPLNLKVNHKADKVTRYSLIVNKASPLSLVKRVIRKLLRATKWQK